MAPNLFGMRRKHTDEERLVIGFFAYASEARRALNSLHEHQFSSDQVVAAFRETLPEETRRSTAKSAASGNGKWFGQLRQIYRGDEQAPSGGRSEDREASSAGFEAMLEQVDPLSTDVSAVDLDRGGALVMVRAGSRDQEARVLLEKLGARLLPVRPRTELQDGLSHAPETTISSIPFQPPATAEPGHIQLFGEVVRVRKEKVSSGDVRVSKETSTHMEIVQIPVTREHLVIEHTDGAGTPDDERVVRVPLSEERVHIDKDTVLREEYKVGKREITQNQAVTDTVRRERLLVDDASETNGK